MSILPIELAPVAKLLERDPPKVLVLVGAGVSAGATSAAHSSWLGLLKHGVEYLVKTKVFTDQRGEELMASLDVAFSPFDLKCALQHAELIEQNLTTPDASAFDRWLEAAFYDFKLLTSASKVLDALSDLQAAGALILTTNYDSLLSDVTGLPPVTWEQHNELLQVISRQKLGILHIHGHWQRPSSVVLGKGSYNRIVQDQDFQDAFKSLWLEWSWVYVGCGNGLEDPNLGRLLEWGKRWGSGALPDYFLTKTAKAEEIANRPGQPTNLVIVGYPDNADLPEILHSVLPVAHTWPFIPVDEDFGFFRNASSLITVPFPSRKEYLDGNVPGFATDREIGVRLTEHGWAFVLDVASVGKTTMALRMATDSAQRDFPTYYFDLASVSAADAGEEARDALRRLSRPNVLLILDNVHHEPELARLVWDQWRDRPRDSKLLLIATRMQRTVTTEPTQDLGFFEKHATNPVVELRPTPNDLWAIMKHLYHRVCGDGARPLSVPPPVVLEDWHRKYGSSLGAFCLAVLARLTMLQRGNWELPFEAASDWVRAKWMKPLDAANLENLLCLAVCGAQELELQIQNEALPHPGRTDQLLRMGLVAKTEKGHYGQYHRFNLREPGWGGLVIAAQTPSLNEEAILFETAARHGSAAITLSLRLRGERFVDRLTRLWAYIANHPDCLLNNIANTELIDVVRLAEFAAISNQPLLAGQFWQAIERTPDTFVAQALETRLAGVTSFIETAKRRLRNTEPFWQAIERAPDRFAASAWETPLGEIASFLDTARRCHRNSEPLWQVIEREPEKLVARALETPLGNLGSFLDTAKKCHRNTEQLWRAIESEPQKFASRAWKTPLGELAAFLDTAKRCSRNTEPLWRAIECEPEKLVARAWETPLGNLASFLDTAKKCHRNTEQLWRAIESEPERFAARAWEMPLSDLMSFFDTAKRHQRNIEPLWGAIESEPEKLVARAWEAPLNFLALFFDTLKTHRRNTEPLWQAIEREPEKLAARAWETPLSDLALFLDTASRHQRNSEPLWRAIEREPEKLVACAWETPLGGVSYFLRVTEKQGRASSAFVKEMEITQLSSKGKEASTRDLGQFCHYAPIALVKMAIANIQPNHWEGISALEPLIGLAWIASRCAEAGREDLESAFITTLLRRANPQDFPPHPRGLSDVASLLRNVPATAKPFLPAFLDALCTHRWLDWQFENSSRGPLASGLRLLGLHQPPQVCQRFLSRSLVSRLRTELWQFSNFNQREQSQTIQLLGCAALCGIVPRSDWLSGVPLKQVGALPAGLSPSRPDTLKVSPWELQLWLGLRVVAFATRKPIEIPFIIINQTLQLWRNNLSDTALDAASVEHRINETMVAWLEKSSHGNQGLLVPESIA